VAGSLSAAAGWKPSNSNNNKHDPGPEKTRFNMYGPLGVPIV
jgi:hypothetical protein